MTPGAPSDVYQPHTPLEPDTALKVDIDAAEVMAMWFELTDMALRAFAAAIAEDAPTEAQLWPEHFDLAMTADRINYGGSLGDSYIDVPYLYVGPFEGRPENPDPFWNQSFGAAIGFDEIASIQDAFDFYGRGRLLARKSRSIPDPHACARGQRMNSPALTRIDWPVIMRARSDSRNTTDSATSSSAGISPSGMLAVIPPITCSTGMFCCSATMLT